MNDTITRYIQSCTSCNKFKGKTNKAPFSPYAPGKPGEHLICDILGPFPKTQKGNKYIVSFMDRYTSWPEAFAIPSTECERIADIMMTEMIPRYGTPRTFLTDQGTNFTAKLMKNLCDKLGIEKIQTSPYHPSSNGMIERMNQNITTGISHYVNNEQDNWDDLLPGLLHAYRSTPTRSRGFSPYEMLYGRKMILPPDVKYDPQECEPNDEEGYMKKLNEQLKHTRKIADEILQTTRTEMEQGQNQMNFAPYEEGQYVWLKTIPKQGKNKKLAAKFTGPHKIIRRITPVLYFLETPTKFMLKYPVHYDRLKLHKGNEPQDLEVKESTRKITEENWESKILNPQEKDEIPKLKISRKWNKRSNYNGMKTGQGEDNLHITHVNQSKAN